jgi:broad specificity polyphosphatase/5'/3'-nucleotidase SurE
VVNVNFPVETDADTPIIDTFPAKLRLGSLFAETSSGKFTFHYSDGFVADPDPNTDRAVLESGGISRSLLDFSRIGKRN